MIFPDIKTQVLEIYRNEFLKLNKLKIGDEIEASFYYHQLHPKYNSRKMERFTFYQDARGILKEDINGLYIESLDDFTFYEFTSNGLTGRHRRTSFKSIKKKSIRNVRGGLDF